MSAEEIESLFKSMTTYQLNIFKIRKDLGLLGEDEIALKEQENKLLDDAIDKYLARYGLQRQNGELSQDLIEKLLTESGYNQEVIDLLMQRKQLQEDQNKLQDEYNDKLNEELGFLKGIKNEELDSLKRKYLDVQRLLDQKAITEDE